MTYRVSSGWGPLSGKSWLLVIACALGLYGINLGGARALTEHEIYVGGVAKQMVAEGQWILPRIGDHLWLEKPPLPHWLASISGIVAGDFSEAAVRTPSMLAGLGVVLLVAGLAGHWFGQQAGLLAGLLQASTVYMLTYARLAEADMLLAVLVVGSIAVFVRIQSVGAIDGRRGPQAALGWRLTFWALLGLTTLCKGPFFGAALVLVPCLGWLASRRDGAGLRRLWSPAGVLLGAALAVLWPALVIPRAPEALSLWNDHLFGRASGRVDFNIEPAWYYLTTWPWQLLPWTPLVLMGAGPSLRRAWHEGDSPDRFIWCWALLPPLVLSLSKGKHHHYLIHSLPALSPVMALGLLRCQEWFLRRPERAILCGRLAEWVLVPAGITFTAAAAWYLAAVRSEVLVLGALVTAGFAACGLSLRRKLLTPTFGLLLLVILGAELYVHVRVLPQRDPSAADRAFLSAVAQQVPAGARLFACGGPEVARHIFYIKRPVEGVWDPMDLAPRLLTPQRIYVVARARDEGVLRRLGRVTRIGQSARTRGEKSPNERYTLFRIDGTKVAHPPASSPGYEPGRFANVFANDP